MTAWETALLIRDLNMSSNVHKMTSAIQLAIDDAVRETYDLVNTEKVVVPALEVKISSMVDLLNLIRDNLDPDNSLCDAIEDVIGERR